LGPLILKIFNRPVKAFAAPKVTRTRCTLRYLYTYIILCIRLYEQRYKIIEGLTVFSLTIQSVFHFNFFLHSIRVPDFIMQIHDEPQACKTIRNSGFSSEYGATHGRNIHVPLLTSAKILFIL